LKSANIKREKMLYPGAPAKVADAKLQAPPQKRSDAGFAVVLVREWYEFR